MYVSDCPMAGIFNCSTKVNFQPIPMLGITKKRLLKDRKTFAEITKSLNGQGFKTSRGGQFQIVQVQRIYEKILCHSVKLTKRNDKAEQSYKIILPFSFPNLNESCLKHKFYHLSKNIFLFFPLQ